MIGLKGPFVPGEHAGARTSKYGTVIFALGHEQARLQPAKAL